MNPKNQKEQTENNKTAAPEKNSADVLKELQKERKSKVLVYIVSTRSGVNFQIADDAVRIIYDHLASLDLGKDNKLDLFLHSFGGVGTIPWKLVNLIREHTTSFEVLVPYKAYSAATLIALGANKIIMHPMGELGPIDPKVANDFNPVTPQGQRIGINVEDVASYISFVKKFVEIRHEDELVQALNSLTDKVHPLALGNVHRFYSQSRMMARKLLRLHMDPKKEEHVINEIVETLTSKLFFHGHPINRKEGKKLNLKIKAPEVKVQKLMWNLYLQYEKELKMKIPFNPQEELNKSGQDTIDSIELVGACIETERKKNSFVSEFKITRPPVPQNAPLPLRIQASTQAILIPLGSRWEEENND
jgi:ribosomal protein S25